jgi:predicted RNase H-like nuclease (RuvC/YqgF family)
MVTNYRLIAAAALGFAVAWLAQDWRLGAKLAEQKLEQVTAEASRTEHTLEAVTLNSTSVAEHSSDQQKNLHAYTEKISELQAARSADAAHIKRLQHDIRAAATAYAQASSDAAACRNLANQHEKLATDLAEGAGVVAELVSVVRRRDSEVELLQGQIKLDRDLLSKLK